MSSESQVTVTAASTSSAATTASAAATSSAATEASIDISSSGLEGRLNSFLEEGEEISFHRTGGSVAASYFVQIKNSTSKKSHLCVLCTEKVRARLQLMISVGNGYFKFAVQNAQNRLTTHHKEHNTEKAFTYKFKPSFTGHSNTLDGLWKATAAKQPISKYESAKRRYFDSLPQLTEEVQELIEHHLLKLCACRLLPYSFVEWTELQELIDVCLMLPPAKVSGELGIDMI